MSMTMKSHQWMRVIELKRRDKQRKEKERRSSNAVYLICNVEYMSSMMTRSKNENTAKATNTHKYASAFRSGYFSFSISLSIVRLHRLLSLSTSLYLIANSFLCGLLFIAMKFPVLLTDQHLKTAWLPFVHTKSIKSFDICICAFFCVSFLCFVCFSILFCTIYEYGVHQMRCFFPLDLFSRSGPFLSFASMSKNLQTML